ncbi:MAG: hypothetical protein AAF333_18795 [Planctomycetota bacterium]
MKFFTFEWWRDDCFDAAPLERYRDHLERLRHRVPDDLMRLQESVSLHDAEVRRLEILPGERRLLLSLDGDDGRGNPRRFSLNYEGVEAYRSLPRPDAGQLGSVGYGRLGYHEVHPVDDDCLLHCIAFSSGIEVEIVFRGFRAAWEDRV